MVQAYYASTTFAELAPKTRETYQRVLADLVADLGGADPRAITPAAVARLRDALRETPGKAYTSMVALGALYAWGLELGWAEINPVRGVKKPKLGEHQPWPEAALRAIDEALRPDLAWVLTVLLHTGQRLGDVLKATHGDISGYRLRVVQEKTGRDLLIPLHQKLHGLVRIAKPPETPICLHHTGRPWTKDSFHGAWREVKAKPGLPFAGLVAHGLRKNATVKLLEAGCSEAETAAVTGMSLKMVMHYGKSARQKVLADSAMKKVDLYPGTAGLD
jgi:integrase